MTLNLLSFQNAILQLEEALSCHFEIVNRDERLARHLRAGAIQAFEFTYELCVKTLKRYLEQTESNPSIVEKLTFDELIRRGFEIELLQEEISVWRDFRKSRGTTSHTYDEQKAKNIFESIPRFLTEAKYLYGEIEKRQGFAS